MQEEALQTMDSEMKSEQQSLSHATSGWGQVSEILELLIRPTFPDLDFCITNYGAAGNGVADCTHAFKKAIEAAHDKGGGRVVVPEGTYLTGPIHLKSNVNLYVSDGATIKFSQDPASYLPLVFSRWEGVELYNYSPLIFGYNLENVAITGTGTIDGQADLDHWWYWKGKEKHGWKEGLPHQKESRDLLFDMAENNVPIEKRQFGEGHYLRPNFIQPFKCKNVLIEGVRIINSPMWNIYPVLCENVIVQDVSMIGHGPNNDGVDPESCKNVLIKNCHFDNGDDNIAIKSGRNADGRRINVPSENIIIQGNYMKDGHGAIVIGSEISGNVRNVFAEDNVMDSPNLDRVFRIKTNSVRGGIVENIYLRNNYVKRVGESVIRINMFYEEGDSGEYTPVVRNINVKNLKSDSGNFGLRIEAYERSPVTNFTIEDCILENVKHPMLIKGVENLRLLNVLINRDLYDNMPPKTIGKVYGERLSDGTYLDFAQLKLEATDQIGVKRIEYRLETEAEWRTYQKPIVINNEKGKTTMVSYRAVDNAENIETGQHKFIAIEAANIDLLLNIADYGLDRTDKSLENPLKEIKQSFNDGEDELGFNKLQTFKEYITNESGQHIPTLVKQDLVKVISYLMVKSKKGTGTKL